jgi:hypothetical protein
VLSTVTVPDYISLKFFTKQIMTQRRTIQKFTDLLEANPIFTPTKYGEDGPTKLEYNRDAFLETFPQRDLLFRHIAPIYDMMLPSGRGRVDGFDIHFEPTQREHVNEFYELATALAELMEPLFGTIQSNWNSEDSPEVLAYRRPAGLTNPQFATGGPAGFASRTWLGPELVGLIGKERLVALGQPLRWMNYGGVAVDVVHDVLEADLMTLMAAQRTLTDALSDVGVFGDYTKFYAAIPGPAWVQLRKEKNLR